MPAPAAGGMSFGSMALAGLGFAGDLFGSGEDPDYANYWNLRNNEWNQNFSMLQRQDALNQFGAIQAADERNYWAAREDATWARHNDDRAFYATRENDAFNRDLALRQLQIRTADARLAGLHPLVAAGLNPASGPMGSYGGGSSGGYGGTPTPSIAGAPVPMSEMRGKHGQNIMSAIARNFTKREKAEERRDALADAYTRAQIGKTEAETAYWLSETARNNVNGSAARPDNSPKMPVVNVPVEVPFKSAAGVQAGNKADVQLNETPRGGYAPVPTPESAESMESNGGLQFGWFARNQLAPIIGSDAHQKALPKLPKGYYWAYNPGTGQYLKRKGRPPVIWWNPDTWRK